MIIYLYEYEIIFVLKLVIIILGDSTVYIITEYHVTL